jgi:PAS domain S-box-containing protein
MNTLSSKSIKRIMLMTPIFTILVLYLSTPILAWDNHDYSFSPVLDTHHYSRLIQNPNVVKDIELKQEQKTPDSITVILPYYAYLTIKYIFLLFLIILISILFYKNHRLRNENAHLLKEETRYRTILENQEDMLCRFLPDFNLTFVNDKFCDFFQKKRDKLIDTTIWPLIPHIDKEIVNNQIKSITPENPTTTLDMPMLHPNGDMCWYRWSAFAIYTANGVIHHYQATGRDIHDLKNSHNALIQMKEEAENANKAKSDFLARMSHELRTPLNSVIGFASLLIKNKQNNLSGKDVNFLGRIQNNGKHLLSLINQILDLSKIESGRMDFHETAVHLNKLIWEILDQLEHQIRSKKIEILCDIPETIAPIKTDEEKLKQVLFNLLGNAIKFTEKGSIMVRISVNEHTHLPIRLDVIDTGIGIPKEQLSEIFEPFCQADSSTSRQYEGTGLGLTISKSLCNLLGFDIEAESKVGKGSSFHINMNPEPSVIDYVDHVDSDDYKLADTHHSILTNKTVLIVDDEQDAILLLQHTIEEFGCNTLVADSGAEGLKLAAEHLPDLILMDVLMPEMNGWEFLINLKSDAALSDIPVIVVSVVASDLRGVSLGLVDFLDKPVKPDELYKLACKNLQRKRGRALLVEVNNVDRAKTKLLVEKENIDVILASNHEEALDIMNSEIFDFIIIDSSELDQDGAIVIKTVRDNINFNALPLIITVNRDLHEDEIRHLHITDHILHKDNGYKDNLKSSINRILTM